MFGGAWGGVNLWERARGKIARRLTTSYGCEVTYSAIVHHFTTETLSNGEINLARTCSLAVLAAHARSAQIPSRRTRSILDELRTRASTSMDSREMVRGGFESR